ncbi:hypothetical protein WDU99_13475 [Microbacterium sp. Mu-80]|uniref:GGDEF domain-containing protein n=1 Tax=Microbacterium bandirmense TaxID=3122050 RepID=A0ABU8LEC6_9MICO
MITSTLAMPVVALTTLATVMFIGLGFLPRPSRATAVWSAAFTVAMVGSYVWIGQDYLYPEQLRAVGSGLLIGSMGLIWSGLRAYRQQPRQYVSVAITLTFAAPLILLVAVQLGAYGVVFRVVFAAMAVIAALIVAELMRLGPQLRDEALPLMGASTLFIAFAAITIVNGVLVAGGQATVSDSLLFVRTINLIGAAVYVVCALMTVLLLTRSDDSAVQAGNGFESTVRTRLNRAEAAADTSWSLLDIRIDDPDDIRLATTTAAFNAATHRFERDVDAVLPAEADIQRISPTRIVVLIPRARGGIRELLPDLLKRISSEHDSDPLPVRMTASVGWAQVSVTGYDYDALLRCASAAALTAHAKGGDRWERVTDATT